MNFRKYFAALALATTMALPVHASMQTLEESYETSLSNLTLPNSNPGRLVLRLCPTCKPVALKVDQRTTFHIGVRTTAVSAEEFRQAAKAAGNAAALLVYVMYLPDSKVVTRVTLDIPNLPATRK